ncbi:hypothetical protein FRC19_001118 [Serendipita sp. 401]|nr:hypothetical protein FRC19_001118 [Serendipita sp. 401]KAG9043542.1 hypothetical protein FS842_001776 [Serendipita sp. 407]
MQALRMYPFFPFLDDYPHIHLSYPFYIPSLSLSISIYSILKLCRLFTSFPFWSLWMTALFFSSLLPPVVSNSILIACSLLHYLRRCDDDGDALPCVCSALLCSALSASLAPLYQTDHFIQTNHLIIKSNSSLFPPHLLCACLLPLSSLSVCV